MKLLEFLKSRPDLVEKMNQCKSEEELKAVIEKEVTDREIQLIQFTEIEELTKEDMINVSGGLDAKEFIKKYGPKAFRFLGAVGFLFQNDFVKVFSGLGEKASLQLGLETSDSKLDLAYTLVGFAVYGAFQAAKYISNPKELKSTEEIIDTNF